MRRTHSPLRVLAPPVGCTASRPGSITVPPGCRRRGRKGGQAGETEFLCVNCRVRETTIHPELLKKLQTRSHSWSEKLCRTTEAATSHAIRSRRIYPACCRGHPLRFLQGFRRCWSPLHGHVDDVQCEVARQSHLAKLFLFWALLYLWAAALEREEFQQMVPSVVLFLLTHIAIFSWWWYVINACT